MAFSGARLAKRCFHANREVFILSAQRTPIGAFRGALASQSASELGAVALRSAISKAGIRPDQVGEAFFGNVLGAGQGQAPARQAAIKAGLPFSTVCTTVNKVCASGTKSIMLGSAQIALGLQEVVAVGGFESMSNVPYYAPQQRAGSGYGHTQLLDGILKDGLWDAFDDHHMGNCAEKCAADYKLTRQDQDAYCIESYRRASAAVAAGNFNAEIVPVSIAGKAKGAVTLVSLDEEPAKLKADKVPTLKPAFLKDGTVTAANSSKLNDGGAALILASGEFVRQHNLKPLARILGMADAEQAPVDFATAPALAIPLALARANRSLAQVDVFEINEAFAAVALANMKILKLDPSKVNVYGGAVSLGHPIGCSGARIAVTLVHALRQLAKPVGVAAICNGGGGASALVVELVL